MARPMAEQGQGGKTHERSFCGLPSRFPGIIGDVDGLGIALRLEVCKEGDWCCPRNHVRSTKASLPDGSPALPLLGSGECTAPFHGTISPCAEHDQREEPQSNPPRGRITLRCSCRYTRALVKSRASFVDWMMLPEAGLNPAAGIDQETDAE